MHRHSFLFLFVCLVWSAAFFSCQQNRSQAPSAQAEPEAPASMNKTPASSAKGKPELDESEASANSAGPEDSPAPAPETFHSLAAATSRWDSLKKLVRSAEVRFRAKDVLQATLAIEDIVQQNGGFVLEDNLTQTENRQYLTAVSRDSSLETSVLDVQNQLVFRVPYAQLDTTLRALGHWAELFHYRRIHTEDKTFDALEEQLTELRNRQYQNRIESAAAQPGGKLNAVTNAIDKAYSGREAADAARLEQLRLADAVQLSVVKVDLYQRPVVRREMVANLKQVASWRPGFGAQLKEALVDGWRALEALLVLITSIWSVLLIAGGITWAVWRRRRSRPTVS